MPRYQIPVMLKLIVDIDTDTGVVSDIMPAVSEGATAFTDGESDRQALAWRFGGPADPDGDPDDPWTDVTGDEAQAVLTAVNLADWPAINAWSEGA